MIRGFVVFVVFLGALITGPLVHAAELAVIVAKTPQAGESIMVTIALDTKEDLINALEGTLSYPREQLRLIGIRSGNSLVNFWLETPVDTEKGIRFAGITPGGYRGSRGAVFSLSFDVLQTGDVRFALTDARALANDGEGSSIPLSLASEVRIEPENVSALATLDTTAPESFTVTRSSSPDLFEGRPFLVFQAQDKQSGITYYEIAEGNWVKYPPFLQRFLEFKRASSPYEIQTVGDSVYIYVRAIDGAGNVRLSILSPERSFIPEGKYLIIGILLVLALSSVLYLRHVRRPQH